MDREGIAKAVQTYAKQPKTTPGWPEAAMIAAITVYVTTAEKNRPKANQERAHKLLSEFCSCYGEVEQDQETAKRECDRLAEWLTKNPDPAPA